MPSAPSTARSTRHRVFRTTLTGLAGLGLLSGLAIFAIHIQRDPLADVRAYYDAAARLNAGIPLYDQHASTNEAGFYRYPPLLAIAFRPLALLPYDLAAILWEAVVVASFVLTVWRLGFRFRTALAVGLLAFPIGWSLAIGQAHVPMTLLMAIGSPWAIALAANLKVLPMLMAIWWIGRRDWQSLRRFAIWMVGLGLLQLLLEPSNSLAFPKVLSLAHVGQVRNWSPFALSPELWALLVIAGTFLTLRLAPTRYGWAAAVALSVLSSPRLLLYQLMALLPAIREPSRSGPSNPPDDPGR